MKGSAFDVIGDIHGQADKLHALLKRLGYTPSAGTYRPPAGRQAVFIGDLIDRGPAQIEVLRLVRGMIDAGHARAVMGNHEFNAIGYVTPNPDRPGEFLRPHCPKNLKQHREFLAQVGEGSPEHRNWIEWFKTLPVALALDGIRAVHACWRDEDVARVQSATSHGRLDEGFLHRAYQQHSPDYHAMECLLKGIEIALPNGTSYVDHGGVLRRDARTRWWLPEPQSYREVVIVEPHRVGDIPEAPLPNDYQPLPVHGSPVFVGHYWMRGTPQVQAPKVACVDYSAASDGPLVAYRWEGEITLDAGNFVAVGA